MYILSKQSHIDTIKILNTVEKRTKDAMTKEFAEGIRDWLADKDYLTPNQATWVCRNCEYWNLDRPQELVDVQVATKRRSDYVKDAKKKAPTRTIDEEAILAALACDNPRRFGTMDASYSPKSDEAFRATGLRVKGRVPEEISGELTVVDIADELAKLTARLRKLA